MSNTKYIVVNEERISSLIQKVEEKLKQGWQLQGGVSVAISPGSWIIHCQALTKQEAEKGERTP